MSDKPSKEAQFFVAGRQITAGQNTWALAGDYLSAAAFLGAAGLYFSSGFDSFYYAVATLLGWPLLLILFAQKLRQTGAFTLSGILAQRFHSQRLQYASAFTGLIVCLFYLLVQLVGAGKLLQLLFGFSYTFALAIMCVLTFLLVAIGGMKAATWVQIIKAVGLFLCALVLVVLVLKQFDFQLSFLWQQVAVLSHGQAFLPSNALKHPVEQISLLLGLVLGLLGLPHVLMRFFTVANGTMAIRSAAWAGVLIFVFFCFNLVIGFGGYVLLQGQVVTGSSNMIILYLAEFLGGSNLKWIVSWVVWATILAVLSGLLISASAILSRDILPCFFKTSASSLLSAKVSVLILMLLAATLAYIFADFNIVFLLGLVFAWAASAHFPVLFLSFFYQPLTEFGALISLLSGALLSLILIIFSPAVWVNILSFQTAIFPFNHPTLFALPVSLILGVLCSYERKK